MSALGGWILGILGVVVLGVVLDLVLPSGRMRKYIQSVFAAVTVLVIILPLPNFAKNGCSTENFVFDGDVPLEEGYLEYTEFVKKNAMVRGLKEALAADGVTLGDLIVEGDFTAIVPQVKEIRINFRQVVIVGQSEHINKYELVQGLVSEYLAIEKDAVKFYEQ